MVHVFVFRQSVVSMAIGRLAYLDNCQDDRHFANHACVSHSPFRHISVHEYMKVKHLKCQSSLCWQDGRFCFVLFIPSQKKLAEDMRSVWTVPLPDVGVFRVHTLCSVVIRTHRSDS